MKKRYEVRGMMEWHPEFVVGRSRVKVSFTGGQLCSGCSSPAVFETSDPVVQLVIERSSAFRIGRIKLTKEKGHSCPQPSSEQAAQSRAVRQMATAVESDESIGKDSLRGADMKFGKMEDAVEFLHYKKGVPLAALMDGESCVVEGRKLGINIVFET